MLEFERDTLIGANVHRFASSQQHESLLLTGNATTTQQLMVSSPQAHWPDIRTWPVNTA